MSRDQFGIINQSWTPIAEGKTLLISDVETDGKQQKPTVSFACSSMPKLKLSKAV